MRARGVLVIAGCFACSVAQASDIISAAPDAVELTIYRNRYTTSSDEILAGQIEDSLGMVSEQRTVELPAGRSRLVFRDVAALLVPQTARLTGLPGRVLERNFDYDLLSPGALIAKSIGQPVRVLRVDPRTGRSIELAGTLRSGPQGIVIEIDGRLEPLDCSDHGDQLIFERVPERLVDVPTLSMDVEAERAGRHELELSYLALGLAWSADYVAHIRPDGRTLDLSGWLTLGNISDTTFADVPIRTIAGKLAREADTVPHDAPRLERTTRCWPTPRYSVPPAPASAESAREVVIVTSSYIIDPQALGDYKLYSLTDATTLAARQSKQVQFLDRRAVAFQRVYSVEAEYDTPELILRLTNDRASQLGLPLPGGSIFVRESAASGREVHAGESRLDDVPVDQSIDLRLGAALDLSVKTTILENQRRGVAELNAHRQRLRVEMANAKSVAVNLELHQSQRGTDFRISRGARGFQRRYDHWVRPLRLAAGARIVIEYTIEWLDKE